MTLKTSHIQELKRRYASMYTKEETLDEHCGVCDEQGIEEAKPPRKLAKRDVGMECMECGNKFRAKLSTLQYGKTKCPNCKSTDLDFAYGESVEEEVEIDEKWAVGVVYHQDFGSGEISYFRADSLLKNRRWKGMAVDEYGGKQKKPRNITADEKTAGWEITPKNKIPKGLKEEVELDEATGNEIKKYMKSKWGISVKASKVGTGKFMRAMGDIPNEFRALVIKKFNPDAKIMNKNNINYGNIRDTDVALKVDQWDELMKEEVEIDEAFFKVKIPDVAPTFIEASSAGAVKASMRKVLKPDVVADLEIERVTPAAMKKMYRDMAQGKDEVDESVVESNELQAIMALDDVGIKATINKKDQVVVKKKDLKKAEDALKKSFRKGGAPELHVEEVEIEEGTAYPPTIDNLRMIVKDKQHQTFMFKSGQAKVDLFTASAMVQVYDALKKPEMKKTFEKMIKDKAGFLKTQAFAMKMLSGGK